MRESGEFWWPRRIHCRGALEGRHSNIGFSAYIGPQAGRLLGYPLEQWYRRSTRSPISIPTTRSLRSTPACVALSESTEVVGFGFR